MNPFFNIFITGLFIFVLSVTLIISDIISSKNNSGAIALFSLTMFVVGTVIGRFLL